MYVILGAGLSGLSASYHIGHKNCILFEKSNHATGHIHSEYINGFTWDEGPHVSFTPHVYVKDLLAESVENNLLEYPVKAVNYYKGDWIPHPAQSNLFAIPQPLRDQCLSDFLKARNFYPDDFRPQNYKEWLEYSLGHEFVEKFSAPYTRKYWTTDPDNLTTDWVGERVFFPQIEQVKEGYLAPLKEETHYIKKVRYPANGGFMSFANKLLTNANIKLEHELASIDFDTKKVEFFNGAQVFYDKLISTIPLPILIEKSNAPAKVKSAAKKLKCSSVLLINLMVNHPATRADNWIYVYDEDKFSTRINCTELLSPNNAPTGKSGIQVEVYFSDYKNKAESDSTIADKVIHEILEMGLILSYEHIEGYHTKWITWANVIFDHERLEAQNIVFDYLAQHGLKRETDDMKPMTDWNHKLKSNEILGDIILAGRFGQWKYFWTDDCIMRGKYIGENHEKE